MIESKIRRELLRLAKTHQGMLHPKNVVDAARAKSSPLHSSFEWDDTEAAEKWRLEQARRLIRVTVTLVPLKKGAQPHQRAFVSLTSDRKKGGGYRATVNVMTDEEQRRELLDDARAELASFKRKYGKLIELAKVFEAIDEVENTLEAPQPVAAQA